MATAREPGRTYFGIQALRAVAALAVVGQHAAERWYIWIMHRPVEDIPWVNGRAGVDIFFVISGFVMMVSLPGLQGKTNPGGVFLWRRFLRIVPLYWFFTTLNLFKLRWGLSAVGATTGSAWHVVASYLFIPSMDEGGTPVPVLPVGWTLQYEMLFYFLFAFALAAGIAPLAFLLPSLSLIAAASAFADPSWPAVLQGWVSPLVLEFLAGAILGHFALRRRLPGPRTGALLLVGGLAVLFSLPIGAVGRVVCWGLPATAVVAGGIALEDRLGSRIPKWLLELGNASYAIYLVHLFVLPFVRVAVERLGFTGLPALGWTLSISLLASALAGEAVHRLLETPLTTLLRGRRVRGVSVLAA